MTAKQYSACSFCRKSAAIKPLYFCIVHDCDHRGELYCQACGNTCHGESEHTFEANNIKPIQLDIVEAKIEDGMELTKRAIQNAALDTTSSLISQYQGTYLNVTQIHGILVKAGYNIMESKQKTAMSDSHRFTALGMSIGSKLPGSYSTVIGGVIGGIIGSILGYKCFDLCDKYIAKMCDYVGQKEQNKRKQMIRDALRLFGIIDMKEVVKTYRMLAKKYHPDKHDRTPESYVKWHEINAALGILIALLEKRSLPTSILVKHIQAIKWNRGASVQTVEEEKEQLAVDQVGHEETLYTSIPTSPLNFNKRIGEYQCIDLKYPKNKSSEEMTKYIKNLYDVLLLKCSKSEVHSFFRKIHGEIEAEMIRQIFDSQRLDFDYLSTLKDINGQCKVEFTEQKVNEEYMIPIIENTNDLVTIMGNVNLNKIKQTKIKTPVIIQEINAANETKENQTWSEMSEQKQKMTPKEHSKNIFWSKMHYFHFNFHLHRNFDLWQGNKSEQVFKKELGSVMNIHPSNIQIQSVTKGSTTVKVRLKMASAVLVAGIIAVLYTSTGWKNYQGDPNYGGLQLRLNQRIEVQDQLQAFYGGQWYPATVITIKTGTMEIRYNRELHSGKNRFWVNKEWISPVRFNQRIRIHDLQIIPHQNGIGVGAHNIGWQRATANVADLTTGNYCCVEQDDVWHLCQVLERQLLNDDPSRVKVKVVSLANDNMIWLRLWAIEDLARISLDDLRSQ